MDNTSFSIGNITTEVLTRDEDQYHKFKAQMLHVGQMAIHFGQPFEKENGVKYIATTEHLNAIPDWTGKNLSELVTYLGV